jgi:hypothetical protein
VGIRSKSITRESEEEEEGHLTYSEVRPDGNR